MQSFSLRSANRRVGGDKNKIFLCHGSATFFFSVYLLYAESNKQTQTSMPILSRNFCFIFPLHFQVVVPSDSASPSHTLSTGFPSNIAAPASTGAFLQPRPITGAGGPCVPAGPEAKTHGDVPGPALRTLPPPGTPAPGDHQTAVQNSTNDAQDSPNSGFNTTPLALEDAEEHVQVATTDPPTLFGEDASDPAVPQNETGTASTTTSPDCVGVHDSIFASANMHRRTRLLVHVGRSTVVICGTS